MIRIGANEMGRKGDEGDHTEVEKVHQNHDAIDASRDK